MSYCVTINKKFKALQGLKSPIRNSKNLPSLQPFDGYEIRLSVGVQFEDVQIGNQGWFIDTDSVDESLTKIATKLAGQRWTEIFEFRPTFEQVTRWIYEQLYPDIPQLQFAELDNLTLGINTKYEGTK